MFIICSVCPVAMIPNQSAAILGNFFFRAETRRSLRCSHPRALRIPINCAPTALHGTAGSKKALHNKESTASSRLEIQQLLARGTDTLLRAQVDYAKYLFRWASSTCSVRSEDLGYWQLQGRPYGRGFPFPIDGEGGADHDFRHAVFEMVLNKNYYAPANLEGANVLEIYTRTGILAIDIADEDSSCLVIGVDESEMQADLVPPNLRFEICNLEEDNDWTWRQRFRLIIIRQHGVFVKDLPALIRRCQEHLEDEGWIELQILTLRHHSLQQPPTNEESKIQDLHRHLSVGLAALGRQLDIQDDLPQILQENGFRDLNHLKWHVPLGPWPKDMELKNIGLYWWAAFRQELEALTLLPLMEGLQWNYDRYQTFLMDVRLELNRWARLRMVTELHVFHARKVSI